MTSFAKYIRSFWFVFPLIFNFSNSLLAYNLAPPDSYIGLVTTNVPDQFSEYSYTFTPSVTGANYIGFAFRQDPAFWYFGNVSLTENNGLPISGSGLISNGNFANGSGYKADNWGIWYQNNVIPPAAGVWFGPNNNLGVFSSSTGQGVFTSSAGGWFDGAVGSFDGIFQAASLTQGTQYVISFSALSNHAVEDWWNTLAIYAGACSDPSDSIFTCDPGTGSGFSIGATPSGATVINASGMVAARLLPGSLLPLLPIFQGGTLVLDGTPLTPYDFSLGIANGIIDIHGQLTNNVISRPITDYLAGTPGSISISDSLGSGNLVFSAINTYTGSTTINTGATLALSGEGSIATSSSVNVDGIFDISQITPPSAIVKTLNGSGVVKLGKNTLTIGADGASTQNFSGQIQDGGIVPDTQGSIVIAGNGYTQNLSGDNSYTGSTTVNTGATLALINSGSIATSNQVTNHGIFDITGASGNATLSRYTQSSSGNLAMNFSPVNNQQLNITGLTQLGGLLTLNASAASYLAGTYTLITSSGLSGNFSSWTDNIGGTLKQRLIYDANNVYLKLYDGPDNLNTQSSMQYQANQLRSASNTQTVAANFALNYDCNVFDVKGLCISAGGRYTTIDNPGINNSAATVTLGYKVNPNIRVGAYLDQNINTSHPTGINISNNTPLMGLYAVWNKEPSGLGYQVRLANTYQDKDVTSTRTVFDTSEAGSGKSSLKSQSYLAELSYAFQYEDKTLVRPYAGLRYTHLKQDGYTEATVIGSVEDPLTVASLKDRSAAALLGVKVNRNLTDKATLTAQLGLEQDLYHKVDNYSATDLNGSELTAVAFNSNIKRTRPVASFGAFYDVTKTQRASATINYQQTPFQSTGSATAYFNYMIGF